MASRRRYPKRGPKPAAPEQGGVSGGSHQSMADQPLKLVDSDAWWSPEDADLAVGRDPDGPGEDDADRSIPARRLLFAGIAIFAITVATVVFLPDIVAVLTPMGAMIAFGAIVASAVVTAAPKREPARHREAEGKAVACGGPRPVGELSRRMAKRKDEDGCGPGGGGSCGC